MAYTDPQSVTINAVPVSLPRTSSGLDTGAFTSADGNVRLAVSSSYGKRTRRSVRLSQRKVSADPFVPDRNIESSMSVYMVVDAPINGYTVAEQKQLVDAFTSYLSASTGARVTQLLGGEN